jgi:uncharacterized membrane protein
MNEQITVNEIFTKSRADLKGQWGSAIGIALLYYIITGSIGLIPKVGFLEFLITGPFMLGLTFVFLNLVDKKDFGVNQLFDGFKINFGKSFLAYLLMILFVFLWLLLLIIPGIIALIGYSQTFFILAENPSIEPIEALRKSKAIMDGHKMEYFMLGLALFGLFILGILTLGIAWFWLLPFAETCKANFYRKLVPENEIDLDYKGEAK